MFEAWNKHRMKLFEPALTVFLATRANSVCWLEDGVTTNTPQRRRNKTNRLGYLQEENVDGLRHDVHGIIKGT